MGSFDKTRRSGTIKQTERRRLRSFIPQLFRQLAATGCQKTAKGNMSGRATWPQARREALPCRSPSTALCLIAPNLSHYGRTSATPEYWGPWRRRDSFISRHCGTAAQERVSLVCLHFHGLFRSGKTTNKTCGGVGVRHSTGGLTFSCSCCCCTPPLCASVGRAVCSDESQKVKVLPKCTRTSGSSINAVHNSLNHNVHQNKGHKCCSAKRRRRRRRKKNNRSHKSVQSPDV